jgi:hypothetical protein
VPQAEDVAVEPLGFGQILVLSISIPGGYVAPFYFRPLKLCLVAPLLDDIGHG